MPPRYLNRRFESISEGPHATFSETVHESRLDLRLSERDLGSAIAMHNSQRALSNEARFAPTYPDAMLLVGDLKFTPDGRDRMIAQTPNGTDIIVGTKVFKADAEAALGILTAHTDALRQTGIISITLGVDDDLKHKGNRIGVCYPTVGRVTFFCDQHGGLLAKSIADVTQQDQTPVDFERAILHELAHLLEHDKKCNNHVEQIADDITRFLLAEPKPAHRQIPRPWSEAAKAINAEYLPARFSAVLHQPTGPSREKAVRAMAHEFLAELISAVAWQNKEIHLDPNCPSSLKNLHDYIRKNGKTFSVAAKIKKLSTQTIQHEKERIMVHSDYIHYHGTARNEEMTAALKKLKRGRGIN